jgi:hypothetical protein
MANFDTFFHFHSIISSVSLTLLAENISKNGAQQKIRFGAQNMWEDIIVALRS